MPTYSPYATYLKAGDIYIHKVYQDTVSATQTIDATSIQSAWMIVIEDGDTISSPGGVYFKMPGMAIGRFWIVVNRSSCDIDIYGVTILPTEGKLVAIKDGTTAYEISHTVPPIDIGSMSTHITMDPSDVLVIGDVASSYDAKKITWTSILSQIVLSGDLSGDMTTTHIVTGLRGYAVAATAPSTGQVLRWSGTAWAPSSLLTDINGLSAITSIDNADYAIVYDTSAALNKKVAWSDITAQLFTGDLWMDGSTPKVSALSGDAGEALTVNATSMVISHSDPMSISYGTTTASSGGSIYISSQESTADVGGSITLEAMAAGDIQLSTGNATSGSTVSGGWIKMSPGAGDTGLESGAVQMHSGVCTVYDDQICMFQTGTTKAVQVSHNTVHLKPVTTNDLPVTPSATSKGALITPLDHGITFSHQQNGSTSVDNHTSVMGDSVYLSSAATVTRSYIPAVGTDFITGQMVIGDQITGASTIYTVWYGGTGSFVFTNMGPSTPTIYPSAGGFSGGKMTVTYTSSSGTSASAIISMTLTTVR